jgi:O-antigen ligase
LGDTVTLDRFEQKRVEVDSTTRLNAYKIALTAIADNPWRGFGLGAFDAAFKMYRDSTVRAWFHHAHNDYLELAVELGVPFALMYLFAVMAAISCCVQGAAKRKRDEVFPILAVAASATVGLHSFVDFSMQIPAVAAIYSGILGLGVAQSWSTRR